MPPLDGRWLILRGTNRQIRRLKYFWMMARTAEPRQAAGTGPPSTPGSPATEFQKMRIRVKDVAAFLKSGKKIQRIPSGVSGQDGLGNRKQLVLGPSSGSKAKK